MKRLRYILLAMAGAFFLNSCSDDDMGAGNPVMTPKTEFSTAMFGDSLEFSANVSDTDVPLSTLKAQLFFGEEKISETIIRTKTNADYSGKIFVPYLANIPNGKATLKLILQNINFTITEKEYDIPLTRPDFDYLTLVSEEKDEDGNNIEYRLERTDLYQYELTAKLPQKVKGYIKSPKANAKGNEIMFGWDNGAVKEGSTSSIPFSNSSAGKYTISFNTLTYAANPFVKLLVNGKEMEMVDDNNYKIDLTLTTGQQIQMNGFPDMDDWWIDPDYFKKENGTMTFLPIDGSYRITANFQYQYFIVETLKDGNPATLQTDGTGAVWIIGEKIGKPSLTNEVGWTTEKALCMAPVAKGKYQITVIGGKSVGTSAINFKFFHQKGWGGEYNKAALTSNSDIVIIPNDDGNLAIAAGKSLEENGIYVFTLDVTAGITKAVLSVEKAGTEVPATFEAIFDGTIMTGIDAENYKVEKEFTQGQEISVSGISKFSTWWIDPDYFTLGDNGKLTFLPISGKYRVTANTTLKYFCVEAMTGNDLASLQADGSGAVWIIGDDMGKPSLNNKISWNTDRALCMAPIGGKKYQITAEAGTNIHTNSINVKFFHQKGWGGEYKSANLTTTSDIVYIGLGNDINNRDDGNLGVLEGKSFIEDKLYVFTLDLSAGNDKAVLTVTEK